jgi:glycosyltransferase involved in cell wall biosynthesis
MKFSVIIPTYNRIKFLEKAIESVSSQTYPNYEIIVVNDNPAEKTQINSLITKFDKTKVIHHTYSKGGNAARNSGILNSEGDLIAFLDDDDVWLPEKLAIHLKEHEKVSNAGLVFSDCLYVYNNKFVNDNVYSPQVPSDIIDAMANARFCPATSSIVSIKRECVEKCGVFDESLVSFQDWDYWFRIAHMFQFVHIPTVLVHFRQHLGDRTSQNENKRRQGLNQICNKWREKINVSEFTKNSIISIYTKNSRNALMTGKKFEALKKSFQLLNSEILSIKSIKVFTMLLLDLAAKRK